MAYEFGLNEQLGAGVRRILREQIGKAERRLCEEGEPERAVHEARKAIKRSRAVLRLVEAAIPKKDFRRENRRLRDAARALAAHRDQDVLCRTLDRLNPEISKLPRSSQKAIAAWRAGICARHSAVGLDTVARMDAHDRALSALKLAGKTAVDLSATDQPIIKGCAPSLRRSYRDGRTFQRQSQHFLGCFTVDQEDAWHEWRKHVQTHWRHMRLLSAAAPEWFGERVELARALSNLLGQDHDLFVLKCEVRRTETAQLALMQQKRLVNFIQTRQRALRVDATQLGGRLYVQPARVLAKQAAHHWRSKACHGKHLIPSHRYSEQSRSNEMNAT